MPWTDFTLRLQTPAFLGDPAARFGDPAAATADTYRVPFPVASLRGVLRYWLRALVGGRVGNDLESLAAVERQVFGTASGRDGSPSAVHLRSRTLIPLTRRQPVWLQPGTTGAVEHDRTHVHYLLGQGLWDRGRLSRRYVPDGTDIVLAVDHCGDGTARAELFLAALWCASMYAGLGARTRRGFGTFTVNPPRLAGDFDLDLFDNGGVDDLPGVIERATRAAMALYPGLGQRPGQPCYPAFVHGWYEDSDEPLDGAMRLGDALAAAGDQLRAHRLDGGDATTEYETIVGPYLDSGHAPREPFRVGAFGLPVNFSDPFGPKDRGGRPTRRSAVAEPTIGKAPARRASPLWLRVYQRNDVWCLRSLALLAEWLPSGTRLHVRDTTPQGDGRPRHARAPITMPTQDQVDAELRGWFTGGRPTRDAPAASPAAAPAPQPTPGPPPQPKPGPRPGPPPGR